MPASERPLSPHLQIYKPLFTMMMSILHRLTGVGLYFGSLIIVWWLMAAASSPAYFDMVRDLLNSFIGKTILLLTCWAFIHHMLGGVRHFIWDFCKGFELRQIEFMARSGMIGSIGLTALIWACL